MEQYLTEEEFLKNYDSKKYDNFAISTDILILSISSTEQNNYRKLSNKHYSVLLVKRKNHPFKDKWCLPGGFVKVDEDLEDAPIRILRDETNLQNIFLEQLYTYGSVNRDPRMRIIATSYMALIDKNRLNEKLTPNSSWFDITKFEENNLVTIILDNGEEQIKFEIQKELKEKTTDRYKFNLISNDKLAFDHPLIILAGLERLKGKIEYTDVVFNMMPEYFTLGELQQVYEVILEKELLDPAFRRIIKDKVVPTEKYKTGAGHRPSRLFKYNKK